MCGLTGYVGKEQAAPIVLQSLSRLEYRGYDSAGIATIGDDRLFVGKDVGKLKDAIQQCDLLLLAYYSALERNLDPDKPRNLAKSVTVK